LKAIEAAGLGDGPEASNVLNNWGVLAVESGQLLKSLDLVRRAIAIEEANMGSDKVNAAMLLNLGRRLNDLNRLDEAWGTMERAGARAAASGLKLIQAYAEQGFAKIRRLQGRFDEALGHLERSRALLGTLSPSSQQAIGLQFAKASIEQDAGRTEAALATLDEARRNFDAQAARAGGRDKLPKVWMGWLQQHASVLGDAGRAAEALPEAQEAMALARRLQGTAEFSADTGGSELLVARLQSKLGRGAEAEALAADAELQLTAALGADHPKTALARALARRVASAR
jgi:tetratricopeptide (TPR) repeat protein